MILILVWLPVATLPACFNIHISLSKSRVLGLGHELTETGRLHCNKAAEMKSRLLLPACQLPLAAATLTLQQPQDQTEKLSKTLRRWVETAKVGSEDCRPVVVQRVWPGCTPPHPSARRAGGCRSRVQGAARCSSLLQFCLLSPAAAPAQEGSAAPAAGCAQVGLQLQLQAPPIKAASSEHDWSAS